MKKWALDISAGARLYRIEILWFLFFTSNSMLGSFLAIATQVDLNELSTYRLILAFASMFFTWTGTMMVFLKKAGSNVSKGKQLVFDDDETQFLKKQDVEYEPPKPVDTNPGTTQPPKV